MAVLVTGAAGFIGFHVARALLDRGETVVGLDNLTPYYDVTLKRARLDRIANRDGFAFYELELSDRDTVQALMDARPDIDRVVHLAAQAGVRHSLVDPYVYVQANIMGQVVLLEAVRRLPALKHVVYASSSSVYGGNKELPFAVSDRVDQPVSLYAASKRADELIGHTYAHLFRLPQTGLRYFTVYGPWGRPDMAAYIFTDRIVRGEPIPVFNYGRMKRDFTYIDDIVAGTLAALDRPPQDDGEHAPHTVYNLGNHRPEQLTDFIAELEKALGRSATKDYQPIQPGDVEATYADIDATHRDLGFWPTTPIGDGIPRFVAWYREYYGI